MQKTEKEIIEQIQNGEKRAYNELVSRYSDRAMSLACRMLGSREDAEEAVQDAFIRAFNALHNFEWKSSFSTWFYRITYNVCATSLQRRGRRIHESAILDETDEIPSADRLPDRILEDAELRTVLKSEIDRMPQAYGTILTLFYLNQQSYDEIASITGLPSGTVKNRLFRARVILRRAVLKKMGYFYQKSDVT